MSAKHTPGPWTLGPIFNQDTPDHQLVREVRFGNKYGTCWIQSAEHCGDEGLTREEVIANARLIAAAPDLLEALETLLASFDSEIHNEYDGTSILADRLAEADHARAAIAKARGEA